MEQREAIERCKERHGFVTDAELPHLGNTMVLVRCGGFRFMAAADQAAQIIEIIERDDENMRDLGMRGDYVRDVSLSVGYERRA